MGQMFVSVTLGNIQFIRGLLNARLHAYIPQVVPSIFTTKVAVVILYYRIITRKINIISTTFLCVGDKLMQMGVVIGRRGIRGRGGVPPIFIEKK